MQDKSSIKEKELTATNRENISMQI